MATETIEKLASRLASSLPDGLASMRDDLESSFRGVLKTSISKLDLVTREEFEVQQAVLLRTREKLERLEGELAKLENNRNA